METLQRTANRGSISTAAYEIDNSVKLEPDNSESFNKTFGSAGNRKTWSYSCWIKKTELFSSNGGALISAYPDVNNRLKIAFSQHKIQVFGKVSGSTTVNVRTNRLYRDTSAFYHILVVFDTTQGTAANRVKIYTNGVLEDSFDQTTYPSENNDEEVGNSSAHYIGQRGDGSSDFYAGYITEINYVNGQALAPTDFGEFDSDTGIWIPKAYSGSYGTNGFYLDFADASDLGDDESGNGNDFTETNIAAADQSTDTPTNNFCTLNPLVNFKYTTNGITEGATTFGDNTGGGVGGAFGTMAVTAGKWYWEVKLTQQSSHYIGVSAVDDGDNVLASTDPHQINSTFNFNIAAARIEYINGGSITAGSLDAFTDFHSAGDIIGIALNMDDNQISIYGNGTLQSGVANTSLFDAANKMVVPFHGTINDECQYNFGGYSAWTPSSAVNDENGYGTFEYSPPSGYYSLCTKNLSEYGG